MKSTKLIFCSLIFCFCSLIHSQTKLIATGSGDTYELINKVLSPGHDAVEVPDCAHAAFGKHINQVYDTDLKRYVFEFTVHTAVDNDRCEKFDRQRVEIKTYGPSPENLKGKEGEIVNYSWKFKIPSGFQPSTSFTHLHQIKAVGGSDGLPLFTLSAKKGKINKLNLVHDNVTILQSAPLNDFIDTWVEVKEIIEVGSNGYYSMKISRLNDGVELLSYSTDKLMTIRADNEFIRPKWGIYRSLNNSSDLRDESVLFADFVIEETKK
ncbi:fibronectin type III [Flavobacterium faecale]|uniref:fibronectin type III n=1 Tax=Flavobacterium faecale TaxID=1355330 RepID=UPI003AAACC66